MTRWRAGLAALAVAALSSAAIEAPAPARLETDRWGRLLAFPGKRELACPRQGDRMAVIVAAGQSNAGNHGEHRGPARHGDRVLNFSGGRCFAAASPLLGATGAGGAYWDALADRLIDAGLADHVVIAPFAVGGSAVERWAPGGRLHRPFLELVAQLRVRYRVTHLLWHQGETDFLSGTAKVRYVALFSSFARAVRAAGVQAPIFIAVASRCTSAPWTPTNPVAEAQRQLAQTLEGALAGADADQVWQAGDRFDGCHLSAAGQEAMALHWERAIR